MNSVSEKPVAQSGARPASAEALNGQATRPKILSMEVGQRTAPVAHMGDQGLVRNSVEDIDAEIERLTRLKALRKEEEAKMSARAKAYAEDEASQVKRVTAELLSECQSMVKALPGEATQMPCPDCSRAGVQIVKSVVVKGKDGDLDRGTTVSIGSPIFTLKKGKDGACRCPRCGGAWYVF